MSQIDLAKRRFVLCIIAVLAAHTAGWYFGGYHVWGVGVWSGLPGWIFAAALTVVLASVFLSSHQPEWLDAALRNVLGHNRIPPLNRFSRVLRPRFSQSQPLL